MMAMINREEILTNSEIIEKFCKKGRHNYYGIVGMKGEWCINCGKEKERKRK
jgi:hypothetical protein